jgi:purine-nucleoside phosphorylase
MPLSGVAGHDGFLRSGLLSGRPVLALCGRVHLYEGKTPAEVCLPVRALAQLGVRTLVLTNAAGALNPLFSAGGLMLITDHINMTGQNPLTGPNIDAFGPRFPDMGRAWCPRPGSPLPAARPRGLGVLVERGVYVQVPGPSLETPAETRAYRRLGADAIGMSTVMEAIAARHMGVRLLGVSCLTNKNSPDCMEEISHEAVLATAARASEQLARLLEALAASPETGHGIRQGVKFSSKPYDTQSRPVTGRVIPLSGRNGGDTMNTARLSILPCIVILLAGWRLPAAATPGTSYYSSLKRTAVDAKNDILGTRPTTTELFVEDKTPLADINFDAADMMVGQFLPDLNKRSPIYFEPFTNRVDLGDPSPFGALVAEQVAARLTQRTFMMTRGQPPRAPKPAEANPPLQSVPMVQTSRGPCLMTGTYLVTPQIIYVSAQVATLDSGLLLGAHTWTIPVNSNTRALLPQLRHTPGGGVKPTVSTKLTGVPHTIANPDGQPQNYVDRDLVR